MPEVSRTYTGGVVVSPEFIPGLVASLDFYKIRLKNAIGQIDGRTMDVQNLCEVSGGTSSYCSLYLRPNPFSDHTAANYPSKVYQQSLNTALVEIEGLDFETNYNFQMSDIVTQWRGGWSVRMLANYQPVDQSQAYANAPRTFVGPTNGLNTFLQQWKVAKTHVTMMLRYDLDDWTFALEDRWHGGFSKVTSPGQIYADPHIHSVNYNDFSVQRNFKAVGGDFTAYLTVQNLFDTKAPLYPTYGSVGLFYPVAPDEDITGRYFTLGLRTTF